MKTSLRIKNGLDVTNDISASNLDITDSYPTIKPSLNLDFINNTTLDPRIDFTRASTGSYIDKRDGLIKYSNVNTPRFEKNGLLIEEARTNLLTKTDSLDSFTINYGSTLKNITIAPDGTQTATKFIEDTTANTHTVVIMNGSLVASTYYTFSCFVKKADYDYIQLNINAGDATGSLYCTLNMNTGVLSSPTTYLTPTALSTPSAKLTPYSNSWYRIEFTFLVTANTSVTNSSIYLHNGSGINYTGDGKSGTYVWGAQLELGSFATSYVPSTETFTSRSSSGTYVNSSGLIASANSNVSRMNYNPANLALAPKLLLENQSTNLCLYSEAFTMGQWSTSYASVTPNATTAPDGTVTADKLTPDTTTAVIHTIAQGITISANTIYTFSVFVKAAEYRYLRIYFGKYTSPYNRISLDIDLITGQYGNYETQVGVPTLSLIHIVEPYSNGWYRVSVGGICDTSSTNGVCEIRAIPSLGGDQSNMIPDGTSGYYIWGAQLEQSYYPSSYIYTAASAVTRNADVYSSATTSRTADIATISGTNFSKWYNQSEGTIYSESDSLKSNYNPVLVIQNAGGSERHQISNGTNCAATVVSSTIQVNNGVNSDLNLKIAYAYKLNDYAISVESNSIITDTSGAIPAVNYMTLGKFDFGGSTSLDGHISKILYYPERLSNTILQNLSK